MSRVEEARRRGRANCARCGVLMFFVRTETWGQLPLNWDPDPKGNVVLFELDGRTYSRTLGREAARPENTVIWMPHVATCSRRDAPKGAQ
jgi:hypothetical protein